MNKYAILGLFLTVFTQVFAQEPNDCVDAITVCGNGTFSSNASGIGNTQEVSGCGGFEHNSLWLEVNIVQAGTLGFDLIPDDPDINVDYDFWVFGPNRICSNLGSPIRCATTNPNQAGLPNNHTGINGSTTLTQTGPGANGNGYVFWLNVNVGETYYIAIDRPAGEGGFELQWTGTAMDGTGAFPAPPEPNTIDDQITCSSTPDIGIFNLNGLSSSISNDLANETVEYYANLADATDGINQLPGIYANTSNPQQIYAKVLSSVTDCYTLVEFNLIVSEIPDAMVSVSPTVICDGESTTFTITGTPSTTVHYTLNGGTTQDVLLDASGTATITESPSVNTTIELINAQVLNASGDVICSQALTQTETVTVNPSVTPLFTQVDPICNGDTLNALPTTSTNGVSGTWSPAVDNTVTTTYTFTPNAGQCATTQTMEIVVNPNVTSTFTQVSPICSGDTLSPLPTTSNNGVTGTWSPALDNTTTTTYTFTPDAGQCGTVETMEIVVNPVVTSAFTQVSPICSGDALSQLPTTSNNGISGTWSPAIDNTTTTTYTFTPDAGQCGTVETMEIVVNPVITPTFTQVTPICSGEALSPLPTTSNNGIIGTWSPAIDNTTTTTYTFTPDAGVCATTQTMEIVVNPSTTPTFTQIPPICSGETLSPLPTTSNNGITGNWSPAINNTSTTTYTFTPDVGQCAATETMEIVVNPIVTPTFTPVDPICSGETLAALPTTSNNGVTGTWNPVIDNTVTTTYTFTPDSGQCATVETLQIVVNPSITPTFTQVAPICEGDALSALPTTSNNGVTGTWSPAINNMATTTYTFTPDAGICASVQTMTIVINPPTAPTFTQVAPICLGDPLSALPTTSNNGIIGTWSPALDNTVTTTYTFTPNPGQCALTQTMTIEVNPFPSIVNPSPLVSCDDTVIDGMTEMNLTVKNDEITASNSDYIVTYHNSLLAAQNGMPEVSPSSTAYIGTDGEVVHVRIEDSNTGCYDTTTLTLNVVTGPSVSTPLPLYDCDLDNDNLGSFDLSPVRDDILASDPTLVVTFHLTYQNALDNVNPQGDSMSNVAGQIIYVRVDFGTGLGCATILELQLIVEPSPIVPTDIDPYVVCDDDSDGTATFNLTTMDPTIYGSQNPSDYILTYHESLTDAESIPGLNPIIEPDLSNYVSGNTTIYVRLEGLNGCVTVGQFDLIVNPLPDIPAEAQDSVFEICDDTSNNDGYVIFDLTSQNDNYTGGDVTLEVDYYETMADIPNNPISNDSAYENTSITGLPHNPQTIFVTVTETTSGGNCYAITTLTLVVNPLPTPNDVLPDLIDCDINNPGDLQEAFDLTQNEGLMLNDFDETVTYHESMADAESGENAITNASSYSNIATPQTIYVRVTNTGDPSDSSDDGTGCYAIITFDLLVNPVPMFTPDELYTICVNTNGTEVVGSPTIDTGLSTTDYTFEWMDPNGVIVSIDSSYTAVQAGTHIVTISDIDTMCFSVISVDVEESSPPIVDAVVVTEAFADGNVIQVTATGNGAAQYEFSIDNGPWVSNDPNMNTYTFTNVSPGEHVIQVRDIYGCGIGSDVVVVMDYPLFFTPNNDGDNDTWQISGISSQMDAKIYIFDRYGKLLKQLSPSSPGWDGTSKGYLLPTSDYWFTVDYKEDGQAKQFRSHFTLKR
ncbi:T9SS type B sorting domain-containing protein [Hanstruepera ponticola]|uniref:T9SS type B sorting domain-containing protein n=1 Tax=Hanstruepera ponticola TaxID=2042995 RepID=UPI00177A9694|nr:T9SS type B sorting domain-containing protein [Hanstruepera ponticola]